MYENVIREFDDNIEDEVFETFSYNITSREIIESKNNLKFLIGDSGTGKTFLVKHQFKDAVFLNGFLDKDDIDHNLTPYRWIIIDEAQLLEQRMIEYVRTLSDTKMYTFLLVMHSNEANEILQKEHFKTRSIDVIKLEKIKKEEMIQYINVKLLKNNTNHIFTNKEFSKIYKYTEGNFRYIKRYMKTLFELLEFAHQNNIYRYQKINDCLITMAAIKLGFEYE